MRARPRHHFVPRQILKDMGQLRQAGALERRPDLTMAVSVRWAGVRCSNVRGESELSIRALTFEGRGAEDGAGAVSELEGPRPARVSGRIRPRYEGDSVVLGSVWAEGPCSADGARASRS